MAHCEHTFHAIKDPESIFETTRTFCQMCRSSNGPQLIEIRYIPTTCMRAKIGILTFIRHALRTFLKKNIAAAVHATAHEVEMLLRYHAGEL